MDSRTGDDSSVGDGDPSRRGNFVINGDITASVGTTNPGIGLTANLSGMLRAISEEIRALPRSSSDLVERALRELTDGFGSSSRRTRYDAAQRRLVRSQLRSLRRLLTNEPELQDAMALRSLVEHASILADQLLETGDGFSVEQKRLEAVLERRVAEALGRRQFGKAGMGSISYHPSNEDEAANSFLRSTPVSVYVDGDHAEVEEALAGVLEAFGLEITDSFPPIRGSWYRAFVTRAKKAATAPEFTSRLAKLERALELQVIHRAQAEVDAAQGDAVAKLITALGKSPDAIIQIGSVLLIKVGGVPVVRNLTQIELGHLERNPALFRDPAAALHELQQVSHNAERVISAD